MSSAEEYLRQIHATMLVRCSGDCLEHARKIRAQLIAEGRDAWVGRLRKIEKLGNTTFHGPLSPIRFRGRAGSVAVFGETIEIERISED